MPVNSASNSTVATSQVGTQPPGDDVELFALPADAGNPDMPDADEPFGSLDLEDMDVDQPVVPPVEEQQVSGDDNAAAQNGQQPADDRQQRPPDVGDALVQAAASRQQQVNTAREQMPLAERINKLVQVSAALVEAQQARTVRSTVRISDVKLQQFSGHPDSGAHCIDTEEFLPLLRWLQDCKARLATYNFVESDKVALLVSALSGGARSVFNDLYADARVCDWSLADAFSNIAALVPDHGVLFTRRALDMTFTAGTLPDDVKTFELYMRYGDMPADGSQFVWTELQNKMLGACPNLFAVAASKHNLHFVWDASKPFAAHVTQALKIVSAMQIFGDIQRSVSTAKSTLQPESGNKRKKPLNPHRVETPAKKKSVPASKGKHDKELSKLAFEHRLCFKCTQHVPTKAGMAEHKLTCSAPPGTFQANMKVVKRLHEQGETGAREIKSRQPILPGQK